MRAKLDSSDNLLRDAMRMAIPVEEPGKMEERREKLLRGIEHQILLSPARLKKNESRRLWALGFKWSAAAAALCLAVGAGMGFQALYQDDASGLAQQKSEESSGAAVQPARLVHSGEHLATQRGERQTLQLPGDTSVSVGERTGLRLLEALPERQVLELDYGRVDVEVTPTQEGPARDVRVKTPHALVVVKGTAFSVDVKAASDDSKALSTRVAVTRGVVLVHHAGGELALKTGESWSSSMRFSSELRMAHSRPALATPAQSNAEASPVEGESEDSSLKADEPVVQNEGKATAQLPTSTLAEENALFERAIAAAQNGRRDRALHLLDEFLARYPRSPLRDAVRAKKTRLLAE